MPAEPSSPKTTPAPSEAHRGSRRVAPLLVVLIVAVFSLLCGLILDAALTARLGHSLLAPTETPTVIPTPTPQAATVARFIQPLGRLETVRYGLETVVSGGRDPGGVIGFIGIGKEKLVLVVPGEVIAGVDVSAITAQDVQVAGDAVTLTLPAPQILVARVDPAGVEVFDHVTGLFTRPDANLQKELLEAAEQDIVDTALRYGILDQAQVNAETQIFRLLYDLGFRDVHFRWRPLPTPEITPTPGE